MGSKSDPPPAPDYAGAARATSAGSLQAAIANNMMMHPNTYTPLGSQTWNQTGTQTVPGAEGNPAVDVPTYSQNINLSPQGQQLYSGQLGLQTGLMGLGQGALDRTAGALNKPFDAGSVGQIADQAYGAQTSRLDPQWAQNEAAQKTQLANQGLAPGGEAYGNAMRVFEQGKNDAYTQARLAAISTMPQTYQLATAARQQPLTELSSIMTGAQPQMPQFQPVQYAGGMTGPNMSGAAGAAGQYAGNVYNQQVAQQNALTSGLLGMGGMIGAGYMLSDRRLKSNIKRISTHRLGIGIYDYDLDGLRQRGVMADELEQVLPFAVATLPSGYKAVHYWML